MFFLRPLRKRQGRQRPVGANGVVVYSVGMTDIVFASFAFCTGIEVIGILTKKVWKSILDPYLD